jgi:hypothetical protein
MRLQNLLQQHKILITKSTIQINYISSTTIMDYSNGIIFSKLTTYLHQQEKETPLKIIKNNEATDC